MSQAPLKCDQPAAKEIYEHLTILDQAGAFNEGLNLDSGYRKLNYRDPFKPEGTVEGKEDGGVSCEETWENGLQALDALGELAKWEENPTEANDSKVKHAIERYQEFRKLIERNTKRAVSYVLEAPHHEVYPGERIRKLKAAKEIRNKTNQTIQKLNELMEKEKLDITQRQRCLIACLYWFVLVGEDGIGEPLDDQGDPWLVSFLPRQGINEETVNKIRSQFSEYLQKSGGGLGLADVEDDAKFEATALEMVLEKRGLCTEQSKVMYAVLRMAGIKAFFVEPRLSIEYFLSKAKPEEKERLKRLTKTPLRSHMASGVGVKILDESGKESAWIVDVGLKLLEADYIKESSGQWETHPYWELSLRHFFMVDLANLGESQTAEVERLIGKRNFKEANKKITEAGQNFETALQRLGRDSAAFYAMGNYVSLLSIKAKQLSCRLKDKRKICEDLDNDIDKYSKETVEINPNNPAFQFNRGLYLTDRKIWEEWEEIIVAFLQSMNADPRYLLPYQNLKFAIQIIWKKFPDRLFSVWDVFINQMEAIGERHPLLKRVIKKDLEAMKSAKPSAGKAIDLIEKLKRNLKLFLD